MKQGKTYEKWKNIILSILFLAVIAGFFVVSLGMKDRDFSENENRKLAQMPALSGKAVLRGDFSDGFEACVQDQFPGRDGFVSAKTRMELAAGKRDNGMVYFGNDGYLFSIEKIDEDQLKKNIGYINDFAARFGDERKVTLMVVPTAANILREKLPKNAVVPDENGAFDIAAKESQVELLDLRETLMEKKEEYIYYRTDHHWTTLGAFYGYCRWKGEEANRENYAEVQVSDAFYGTNASKAMLSSVMPDRMIRFDRKGSHGADMQIFEADGRMKRELNTLYDDAYLKKKDKYSYYLSGNNPVTVIHSKSGPEGKTLLVVKDSFAHCFLPFLTEDYETIVAVDLRYCRRSLDTLTETYEADEILFLYNILNLSQDKNLVFLK